MPLLHVALGGLWVFSLSSLIHSSPSCSSLPFSPAPTSHNYPLLTNLPVCHLNTSTLHDLTGKSNYLNQLHLLWLSMPSTTSISWLFSTWEVTGKPMLQVRPSSLMGTNPPFNSLHLVDSSMISSRLFTAAAVMDGEHKNNGVVLQTPKMLQH